MNFYLKYLFVINVTLLSFGCVGYSAEPKSNHKYPTEQCYKAKHGELDLNLIDTTDPLNNSYLFDCAVSVTISGPSLISGESKSKAIRRAEKEKKTKIANFLLSKEINIKFKNEYGDTLLMSVISSFLPDEWKEKTVEILIKKGVDINEKNSNGDTAMDLAKYKGNANIIKMLSEE